MQPPTGNRISQGQHLSSKAIDYSADPDPFVYAPEDMSFDSYQRRGSGTNDAGNCLRGKGKSGLHQFAHLEQTYWKSGKVKRGERIAKMGHTGHTIPAGVKGTHLHYWVLTPKGYVYPPNLYTKPFQKKENIVKPTKSEVGNMFNYAGVADDKVTKKQYDYYMARDWKVLAQDVAPMIYKKYTGVRDQLRAVQDQLKTLRADITKLEKAQDKLIKQNKELADSIVAKDDQIVALGVELSEKPKHKTVVVEPTYFPIGELIKAIFKKIFRGTK